MTMSAAEAGDAAIHPPSTASGPPAVGRRRLSTPPGATALRSGAAPLCRRAATRQARGAHGRAGSSGHRPLPAAGSPAVPRYVNVGAALSTRRTMMSSTELCFTPATELARLIRTKALSPVELTRAVLERIERVNPIVNAICTLTVDTALARARDAERAVTSGAPLGPLHGIPYSIKDLNFTKGVRTMGGSFIFEHRVPDADAAFIPRLQKAGGVFLGKTTSPEFGWKGLGDSPLTGITRNPWNTGMTTGGSSAGAGAATAAGFGPLHQGSDGAGSIRIPSGFCGIYGLKPSFGRVPMWPTSNNDYASHMGPMTRTVADAALMLSVMAGPDDWDRTSLEAVPDDYVEKLDAGIKGLKVAFSTDLGGFPVDAEVAAVVKQAVRAFEDLGCVVEEVKPTFADSHDLIRCLWSAHEAGDYAQYLGEWRNRMDPGP